MGDKKKEKKIEKKDEFGDTTEKIEVEGRRLVSALNLIA